MDLNAVEAQPAVVAPRGAQTDVRPDPLPSSWSWPRLIVGIAVFLVAIVVPLLRQQGTRSWQAMLAEDGSIYTSEAVRHGGAMVVLRGYAGYLQLPPRLLALPVSLVPVRDLAIYFATVGVTVTALLAWFVYWATDGWITSRPIRFVLASFVVIMPALGGENTANVVNLIWVFAAVTPWALVSRREQRGETGLRAVIVFLAAAGTPVCVVFVPVAVGWAVIRRTSSAMVVAVSLGAGLALQGLVVLTARDTLQSATSNSFAQLFRGVGSRVFGVLLLGTKGVDSLWGRDSAVIFLGAPIIVAVIVGVLMLGAPRPAQILALVFIGCAVVAFLVPVWGRGSEVLDPHSGFVYEPLDYGIALRYSVMPIVLVASAIAVLLAPPGGARHPTARRTASVVFAAQIGLLAVLGFSVHNYRSTNFRWRSTVDRTYDAACRGEPPDRLVTVPANLGDVYSVTLPCWYLSP